MAASYHHNDPSIPISITAPIEYQNDPSATATATAVLACHQADIPSSHAFSSSSLSWCPMDLSSSSFRFDFDRQQSSPSAATLAENVHAREFETQFCRDFHCCGLRLVDLHDLLQHYEECHVRFEDDEDVYDDDDDLAENDSDVLDDDSWSDSDSTPASPSSLTGPTGPAAAVAVLETLLGGGSSSSAAHAGMAAAAAASTAHLHPTFQSPYPPHFGARANHNAHSPYHPLIHSTHPLYRHPSTNSSSINVNECSLAAVSTNNAATAHALDAFAASFHGPTKRKAAVSLADIYLKEDRNEMFKNGPSAFADTILRSSKTNNDDSHNRNSGIKEDDLHDNHHHGSDHPLNPHTKRFALESNQRSAAASIFSDSQAQPAQEKNSTGSRPFPGSLLNPGVHIGPLSTHHPHPQQHFQHFHHPAATGPTGAPYTNAAVTDLRRQREDVYCLIEDLSRGGNVNAGDKPYRCTVLGCDKAYKNPNGLKYHNLHGHCTGIGCDSESLEARPYVCTFLECGKRYKNLNGLKYHIEHSHPNLTAALRAHQSGLINTHIFGPYPSQAAMTIAAALQAVNASPMMMAAANSIMSAQAANADTGASGDTSASSDEADGGSAGLGGGAESGSGRGPGPGVGVGVVGPGPRPVLGIRAGMVSSGVVPGLPGPLAKSHEQRYGLDPGIMETGRGCGSGEEARTRSNEVGANALDAILSM